MHVVEQSLQNLDHGRFCSAALFISTRTCRQDRCKCYSTCGLPVLAACEASSGMHLLFQVVVFQQQLQQRLNQLLVTHLYTTGATKAEGALSNTYVAASNQSQATALN